MSDTRYYKVLLPDGTTKRISKNLSQQGNVGNVSTDPPIGWKKSAEEWYQMLNIKQTPTQKTSKPKSTKKSKLAIEKVNDEKVPEQEEISVPAPKAALNDVDQADIPFFKSIDIESLTLSDIRTHLMSLTGEDLLTTMNRVFLNKLRNVDQLTAESAKIVYEFINHGLTTLEEEHSKNFLYILPVLSMRHINSNLTELWSQEHLHDKKLQDMFKSYVDLRLTQEKQDTETYINQLPKEFGNLVMVGDRMRLALATFLSTESEPVSPDDLISLSINEVYDIVNNLNPSKEATMVQSYFITEFMEHFYHSIIHLYSAMKPNKRIVIPGINATANISTLCTLIDEFSEVINMDLV
jgi:hypothetical protein